VQAIMKKSPYASTWLKTTEERTPFVVLTANLNYWNPLRGPRLNQVIFRNDLSYKKALELCTTTEGEVDILSQVQPEDAHIVQSSPHAKLVRVEGNKVVSGIFNRLRKDVDFNDRRLRLAFNFAVNKEEVIHHGFFGYAHEVPALTPPWAFDFPKGLLPWPHDPHLAKKLLHQAGWPRDKILQIAVTTKYKRVADVIASQISQSLSIKVNVMWIPPSEEIKSKRVVAEKRFVPNWDILLADATALFYEGTPAFFHREFFGADGKLRVGPVIKEFENSFENMARQVEKDDLLEAARKIDRYCFEEALGLFLCSPEQLYAVNKHVEFRPYRTTFELAETEVMRGHWSLE
jgi:peptide/nickel transport system substrate-binding protein